MASPSKRHKAASPALGAQSDFVPLGTETEAAQGYGYGNTAHQSFPASREPRELHHGYGRRGGGRRVDDRPKSKHVLPGYEPWVLVKTKLRRRFVHNTETKESFWYIPKDVMPGVIDFDKWEAEQKEKAANAKWAEEQLKEMREQSKVGEINQAADTEGRSRRRRSESLQREDEAAMLAELAAQAEHQEEQDVKQVVQAVQHIEAGYNSDSSYEEVEVTDSEGEEHDPAKPSGNEIHGQDAEFVRQDPPEGVENAPVEFGEDDIAWQLEAMGEDYGLDPGEYGEGGNDEWDEGAEGLPFTDEDAANLFRDLLDDYRISPFTPWDKIVADESASSILHDDRYTVLPNMRARKEVFDAWAKDKAAQLKQERAAMEKLDPKIPYLAFLHDKATPKLYWPEFKRKFKREADMNDRKLSDKDREKLYRDHINRLKLSESTRKADLIDLLKNMPLKALNRDTRLEALPQQLLSHLHYISLPTSVRDATISSHISRLQPAPEDGDLTDEQRIEEEKRREERRRREKAMAERERQVDEARRRAEKDEMRAKRDLQGEERELQRAMAVSNRGLKAQLLDSERMNTD